MASERWCLALLGLLLGCPAARAPEVAAATSPEPDEVGLAGVAFQRAESWSAPDGGLRLNLPSGWLTRTGSGDILLEGRAGDGSGLSFFVRAWDGSQESLDGIAADRVGWLSQGPYEPPSSVADSVPWVHSRPEGEAQEDLEMGWHFVVGRGYSFVAAVPRVDFEAGLLRIRAVLAGFERADPRP